VSQGKKEKRKGGDQRPRYRRTDKGWRRREEEGGRREDILLGLVSPTNKSRLVFRGLSLSSTEGRTARGWW
jgi:hypothetical protein